MEKILQGKGVVRLAALIQLLQDHLSYLAWGWRCSQELQI